ncbi:hypothetical protein GPX89_31820 [Nocardia sp. ET3-3]|uniref:DUF6542 domain-containing protein n=1 Tax=Nocardia terrae TaxID=2675851 RepID=A0A7K1V580_9NOCA|nr:DUF6542 domain-containing protein [Nocardia terrae]MVU81813.1 hypothetical protein [Nocardia terrae]
MAVTQRERTEVPPSHRSILPSVPGVPAGAAVLIAVTCSFIGFLIDAHGGDDLTGTFATCYVIGCVLAVLIVRYRGLFTTLVLPPLLLFLAVPLFYQLLLGSAGSLKLKDILLNLAIPLVNRFPTMALATVLVLIIGAVRIALHRRESKADASGEPGRARARATRAGSARAQRTRPADPKDPARRRSRSSADTAEADATPESDAARPGRRAAGRVASGPPRVGANRQPGEGRRRRAQEPDQAAAERTSAAPEGGRRRRAQNPEQTAAPEGRRRAQYGENPRAGERRAASGEQQPRTGERRAVPTGERRAVPADRRTPPPAAEAAPEGGRRRRAQSPEQAAGRGTERHAAPERNPAQAPAEGGRRRRPQPSELPPHPRPNVRYRERDSGRIER